MSLWFKQLMYPRASEEEPAAQVETADVEKQIQSSGKSKTLSTSGSNILMKLTHLQLFNHVMMKTVETAVSSGANKQAMSFNNEQPF